MPLLLPVDCKCMLILSNCLTNNADEGCLKVANSLVKRILRIKPDTRVITYERRPGYESRHLSLNKMLVSRQLWAAIRETGESLLYIPFPAREWATALRVFLLSMVCRKQVTVIFTMLCKCNLLGRLLLRLSGARIVTLSQGTVPVYEKAVGAKRVICLKTGVDTEKFLPVDESRKAELRKKYGLDTQKPVVLHVGHLKEGRNVGQLLKLDEKFQVLLVVSTLTKDQQDAKLKTALLQRPNIRIMDAYIPDIQELYQLSDVYFFPVVAEGNCIDVPLSCLEAAACNKPVVTTDYGEMAAFRGRPGFWLLDSFDEAELNRLLAQTLQETSVDTRTSVLEYDWNNAITALAE